MSVQKDPEKKVPAPEKEPAPQAPEAAAAPAEKAPAMKKAPAAKKPAAKKPAAKKPAAKKPAPKKEPARKPAAKAAAPVQEEAPAPAPEQAPALPQPRYVDEHEALVQHGLRRGGRGWRRRLPAGTYELNLPSKGCGKQWLDIFPIVPHGELRKDIARKQEEELPLCRACELRLGHTGQNAAFPLCPQIRQNLPPCSCIPCTHGS